MRVSLRRRWASLLQRFTKENIRRVLKEWAGILLNPRLLVCLLIAWMITNGWSYIFFGLGMWLDIGWMSVVGGAYMSLLWLPFTPEKLLTVIIAIFLMRILFPNDEKTLGVLREKFKKLRRKNREEKPKSEA